MKLRGMDRIRKFRDIKRNWQEMGKRVLEACRHPDITPDQVYEIAQRYRVVSASVFAVRRQIDEDVCSEGFLVRAAWPDVRDLEKP